MLEIHKTALSTPDIYKQMDNLDYLKEAKERAEKNPSKRLGTVEDAANLVEFLLSDKADYINGENLNVNGGILLV